MTVSFIAEEPPQSERPASPGAPQPAHSVDFSHAKKEQQRRKVGPELD